MDDYPDVTCHVIEYSKENIAEKTASVVEDLLPSVESHNQVTWINVNGPYDAALIQKIGELFHIHSLVMEDILNINTRPKFESYDNYAFIALKNILFDRTEGVSIFKNHCFILGENYVISFQVESTNLFDSVRQRLHNRKGRIRSRGADYLCYTLIDTLVDRYYSLLEMLSETIEDIESQILADPSTESLQSIYSLKREVVLLNRAIWPILELVNNMHKDEESFISDDLEPYLHDLSDHAKHLVSTFQTLQDMTSNLQDLYLSLINNNTNKVMRILAIVATIFMPLTFIAGIFGMNFEFMPELKIKMAYPLTLAVMFIISMLMIYYFKRKKWI